MYEIIATDICGDIVTIKNKTIAIISLKEPDSEIDYEKNRRIR